MGRERKFYQFLIGSRKFNEIYCDVFGRSRHEWEDEEIWVFETRRKMINEKNRMLDNRWNPTEIAFEKENCIGLFEDRCGETAHILLVTYSEFQKMGGVMMTLIRHSKIFVFDGYYEKLTEDIKNMYGFPKEGIKDEHGFCKSIVILYEEANK